MPYDGSNQIKNIPQAFRADNAGDSYYTPAWAYEELPIDWSKYNTGFEPCMGDGRIFSFLEDKGIEMDGRDPIYQQDNDEHGIDHVEDFFAWDGYVDLIMTNPPWSNSMDFIKHALPRCGTLLILDKLTKLARVKCHDFWINNEPDALFIHSRRLDFTGRGGASRYETCWYVWQNKEKHIKPGIRHIIGK